MRVLAIDPGCEQSAWVLYDGQRVLAHAIEPNEDITYGFGRHMVRTADRVVIEQIASYGMAVGREVFQTVWWSGRMFQQALTDLSLGCDCSEMPRRDVKLHLCQSARAKDSNVRTALLDRFGGEKAAKGTKAAPGPCYGLRKDEWAALALAVTWVDLHGETKP